MVTVTKQNIYVDVELWKRVKAKAALEGKTMSKWVAEVLDKELKKSG